MPDIIFARARYDYHPYNDLYALITLSGYPLIYFDEIDPQSNNTYILTILNGENQNGWENPRAQIILWDLEWRLDNPPRIAGVSRVWASDRWYARQIGAEYVTLGSHRGLAQGAHVPSAKCYDAMALMYIDPFRRNNLINRMERHGVRVARPAYGTERHARLKQSRSMLHIHQHDGIATIAPIRWAIAAAYGLPVISELVADPHPFYSLTQWHAYETLGNRMCELIASDRLLIRYGAALQQYLCEDTSFGRSVEASV